MLIVDISDRLGFSNRGHTYQNHDIIFKNGHTTKTWHKLVNSKQIYWNHVKIWRNQNTPSSDDKIREINLVLKKPWMWFRDCKLLSLATADRWYKSRVFEHRSHILKSWQNDLKRSNHRIHDKIWWNIDSHIPKSNWNLVKPKNTRYWWQNSRQQKTKTNHECGLEIATYQD